MNGLKRPLFLIILGLNVSVIKGNFTKCSFIDDPNNEWLSFNNGTTCYYARSARVTFHEADDLCRSQNATLVSINSKDENTIVLKLAKKSWFWNDIAWLGLFRDTDSGRKEQWADGKPIVYENWGNQDDPTVHCASIALSTKFGDKGLWYHTNCGERAPFICKKSEKSDPPPKPQLTGECEEGWVRNANVCYKVNPKPLNFQEAALFCTKNWTRSDLVSVHSPEGQEFLTSLLGSTNENLYWLGLYRNNTYQYLWKSNQNVDFINWEPLNYPRGTETCVRIALNGTVGAGYWQRVECDQKLPSICQKYISPKNINPSTAVFPTECTKRSDYVQYKDACFKVYEAKTDWDNAESLCAQYGAGLVSVANELEFLLLKQIANQTIGDFWIGLKGTGKKHEAFTWNDHTPVYFTKWGEFKFEESDSTQCVYQQATGSWIATSDCQVSKAYACKIHLKDKPPKKEVIKRCPTFNTSLDDVQNQWHDVDPQLDFCYKFKWEWHSNGDAQHNCYFDGGNLASIHSEHEAKLLANFAKSQIPKIRRNGIWIGLHRSKSGGFRWIDGSPVEYFNWKEGEPGNSTGEDCVATDNALSNWETLQCKTSRPSYFCAIRKIEIEKKPVKPWESSGTTSVMVLTSLSIVLLAVLGFVGFKYYKIRQAREADDRNLMDVQFSRRKLHNEE